MITYVDANLFTSPAQTLVNTVNTVGVMGKGIAKAFKTVYPGMFEEYRALCVCGALSAGRLLLYRTHHKWVLNFPTKRHWRQPSRLEDIDAGLQTFRQTYGEQGITTVAFPQLGCGNGGLDWEGQVRPLMETHLGSLPIEVFVHVASGAPTGERLVDQDSVTSWLRDDPWPLSFDAFRGDLIAAIDRVRVERRRGNGALDLAHGSDDYERLLDSDYLRALWRRLRSFGYLVPEDVMAALDVPAAPIFGVLATMPYISPVRIAPARSRIAYDENSTQAMLDAPEARGVQIIPPLFGANPAAPSLPRDEDDGSCNESRTTSQLALFSTS